MTSLKNLTILILGFAFLQATFAYSGCQILLYKNSVNDNEQNQMYHYGNYQDNENAPFYGYNDLGFGEERTFSSFRVIDLAWCNYCTVTGYSAKNFGGKKYSEYISNFGRVQFDFCVKSYHLECSQENPEEEEEEEQQE